jgi:voltage-gated potassium channel
VQAGQVVVRRGESADCMFFIVSGDLEVDLESRRIVLEDDFFGEIALLSSSRRSATVTARTRAQLLVLHASHFEAFLDAHPELAETIRRVAEARIAEMAQQR